MEDQTPLVMVEQIHCSTEDPMKEAGLQEEAILYLVVKLGLEI